MTNDITHSMKTCFKCGECQPRENFYKHKGMADGLLGKCKACAKADVLANRLLNIDRIRDYDRKRAKNPERARKAAEINARWRAEDSRRSAAHSAVARAVRRGEIEVTPCIVCGAEKSLAHHESYDRPLDVVWYCQPHHNARHKEMSRKGIKP